MWHSMRNTKVNSLQKNIHKFCLISLSFTFFNIDVNKYLDFGCISPGAGLSFRGRSYRHLKQRIVHRGNLHTENQLRKFTTRYNTRMLQTHIHITNSIIYLLTYISWTTHYQRQLTETSLVLDLCLRILLEHCSSRPPSNHGNRSKWR